jgi:hypothetical protein
MKLEYKLKQFQGINILLRKDNYFNAAYNYHERVPDSFSCIVSHDKVSAKILSGLVIRISTSPQLVLPLRYEPHNSIFSFGSIDNAVFSTWKTRWVCLTLTNCHWMFSRRDP